MQGAEVLTRFTADTKDFDSKAKGLNTSISSIAKGVLAATGITKAFSTAWSMVSRNMGTAIDRFDTLNNFPKVMSNLGISAAESQKSIDKLSEKLVGLPTTLQDGALAVQRLTSKNSDIKKSTDLFLAMNNAILAGGASSQIQSNAIEQLSQAYAKGKPDMMEWRSLMSAMPAQLKQVATAMGYVDADALGESLRDGTVSMDEFMNTIVKLNKKGLPGFQNFEEQARNSTGGIRTAITNMNSRIAQGLEAMIRSINEGLQKANIGNLATLFETVGNTIRDVMKSLAPYITKGIILLSQIASWIIKNKDWLEAIVIPLTVFITTFATISKLIAIVKGVSAAIGILNAVLLANPIVLVIAAVAALIAIFVVLWNKCDWFRNFWIGLWNGIKGLFGDFVEWIKYKINEIGKKITDFKNKVKSVIDGISSFIRGVKDIGLNIVKGIGNGITSGITWLKNRIRDFVGNVTNFIKKTFKIGSPSKLMENEVGQWIPKGIAVGISANTSAIDKSMKEVQSSINASMSPNLNPSSSMHYSPNVNVYNNVDVRQDPLGQMVNNIKTYSGGAKNDYNYGAGF